MEGAEITAPSSSSTAAEAEDDFFSSWEKPKTAAPKPATVVKPGPPILGRTISNATPTPSATPPPESPVPPASRTANRPKLGAARLGSSVTSAAPSTRPARLGAKKAAAPIDFAEAERRALAEEERIKQLGYDRKREEEEEARKRAEELVQAKELGRPSSGNNNTGKPTGTGVGGKGPLLGHQKGSSQDMARLGMGMNRLGFGATASASTLPSTKSR